jgi:3,4-dihydroxy 2-butanone 4-phosphate synthase/GTP cyclohydrolase II
MWIYEGATKAAKAVAQALLDEQEAAAASQQQTGVSAREDGYCFGKQSVEDAIAAVQRGEMVVVVDDENRENEGDFIIPASKVTPEVMATMVRFSSGVICVAMEAQRMEELEIHQMVSVNQDPKGTAFGVSVDAKHGITTGISATDRAITIQLLANPKATSTDFARPGHIFPLRAREGGTLKRDGHTEASVDLSKLAGLYPCGVLCEIVSEENPVEMARLPELKRFCKKHAYILTSIVDIAQYRREMEQ